MHLLDLSYFLGSILGPLTLLDMYKDSFFPLYDDLVPVFDTSTEGNIRYGPLTDAPPLKIPYRL